ncbi:hypothetical protein B7486_53630 [cyanobacterium TDX16]|nr:hypothetical protein B7486_53630 [cyanobacterium TDX16]
MTKALAPDGSPWRVERHWMPRSGVDSPLTRMRRTMGWVGRGAKGADAGAQLAELGELGGPFAIIGAVILLVVMVAVVGLVVVPLLLVVLDLVVVLLLGVALVIGRLLFRRPWTIEVVGPDATKEWKVAGWRASRELKADLRHRIEAGLPLPDADPTGGLFS